MGAARGGWPAQEIRAHTEPLLVDVSEAGREGACMGRFVTLFDAGRFAAASLASCSSKSHYYIAFQADTNKYRQII